MAFIRKIFVLVICFLSNLPLMAVISVVSLKNGHVISGEILVQNEEVIILQTENGQRFQYPKTDVLSIEEKTVQQYAMAESGSNTDNQLPKVAFRIQAMAGAAVIPHGEVGTDFGCDVLIGSRDAFSSRFFFGGSIGYHGCFFTDSSEKYHYIPILFVGSFPLCSSRHAPELGIGCGYGISCQNTKGGLCCTLDLNYRYQFSAKGALLLGAYTRFQQDECPVQEEIDSQYYSGKMGRSLVSAGAKICLQF